MTKAENIAKQTVGPELIVLTGSVKITFGRFVLAQR